LPKIALLTNSRSIVAARLVRTAGVQLAKYFDADVAAVCNTKNVELCSCSITRKGSAAGLLAGALGAEEIVLTSRSWRGEDRLRPPPASSPLTLPSRSSSCVRTLGTTG
jgi:hypothetical protein